MSRERRRQIAISYAILALIVLTVVTLVIVPPLERRAILSDAIEGSKDLYARSHVAIAEAQAAMTRESVDVDAAQLLHADTDALAAAELQQTITAIVDGKDAELTSTAFRRAGDDEMPLVAVPVAVRLRSSVASLVEILQAIDGHEPRLFVTDLAIQSRHSPGRALRELHDELDVQFDVIGYLMSDGESP